MSNRGRSPVYSPIQTPPKEEEPVKTSGFQSSPLSKFISGEDIILVWTILIIIIIVCGIFIYFNYGPGTQPADENTEYYEEVEAIGDEYDTTFVRKHE